MRLCGTACWLRSERWRKSIRTYPYSNCTFHHQNSQRKQTNFTVPTNLIENFGQHNLLYVSLSAWKTGEKLCKNKHGENCFAQVVCWYFVRLCGTACWLRSERWRKSIRTYPYSNCTFHHQNSQRKQTNFTVPTNLGKTLANTIHCMCFFQHHGKQNRTHARTSMVKIALRKLFAGILCGCVVLLVGYEVSDEEKASEPIHILTALFTTRIHKENKQILPYQPTSLKTLANTIYCMCLFQHGKQERNCARTNMVKIALRKLFAGILCGCVVLLVGYEVSDEEKASEPIHILTALFTTRIHKEKQILPYQPTSGKLWPT